MFIDNIKVLEINECDADIFALTVDKSKIGETVRCGQFFNLLPSTEDGMILRRPISVGWQDDRSLTFYIKKLGKGTKWLSKLKSGDELNIMGPLGNGFDPTISSGKNVLLIGGGVGVAPLIELGKAVKSAGAKSIHYSVGFNDEPYGKNYIEEVSDRVRIYSALNRNYLEGYPTHELEKYMEEYDINVVYTCGPDLMMKNTVDTICKSGRDIKVQVSLEERMGCGFGVCLCCSKIVVDKHSTDSDIKKTICVCKEGPVFDGREVY